MAKTLIFAGGSGQRMNSRSKPKQFLEMNGKPIIINTLEHFEYHPEIDEIIIVLIHDGVRPLINDELISLNIQSTIKNGNAITAESVRESVVHCMDGETIDSVPPRDEMYVAKAPQTFYYAKILSLYEKAQQDGIKTIDSSHLCSIYHEPMHLIKSTKNNMKITEPADYYIFKALYEAIEGQQVFGI